MDWDSILRQDVQQFIHEHEQDDEKNLVLQQKEILGIPSRIIAEQIAGKKKAKEKLPSYYKSANIIYPPAVNLEQCSSEATAKFKSTLFTGESMADLTGGFGVDSFFFSHSFKKVDYADTDTEILSIARHNHKILGVSNIVHHNTLADRFLGSSKKQYDLMYLDPSRRDHSRKVYRLSESSPNPLLLMNTILERSKIYVVKASPMLDLKLGVKELKHVLGIYVIAWLGEVKEILFVGDQVGSENPFVQCVDLPEEHTESFRFTFQEEEKSTVDFSPPLHYLYEPSPSILKAGAFKMIGSTFNLFKLHPNTHLYTSSEIHQNFPGRIFRIDQIVKPQPKTVHALLPDNKANIITRNYPLSTNELRKNLKLMDGGPHYLIGFRGMQKTYTVLAARLK